VGTTPAVVADKLPGIVLVTYKSVVCPSTLYPSKVVIEYCQEVEVGARVGGLTMLEIENL